MILKRRWGKSKGSKDHTSRPQRPNVSVQILNNGFQKGLQNVENIF